MLDIVAHFLQMDGSEKRETTEQIKGLLLATFSEMTTSDKDSVIALVNGERKEKVQGLFPGVSHGKLTQAFNKVTADLEQNVSKYRF